VTVQEALGGSGLDAREARLLLAEATGFSQAAVLAFPERVLPPAVQNNFLEYIEKRKRGEPIAYIVGHKEFYGIDLAVNAAVLIPRPETELLVDLALQHDFSNMADLGTGSGAIAIAVKKHRPNVKVVGVEASAAALAVAQRNAVKNGVDIEFRHGRWFEPVAGERFDLIVSNPPYVAAADPHLEALGFEPRQALVAGPDGLDALREIARGVRSHMAPGGWLLLEHGQGQENAVRALLQAAGLEEIATWPDLAGIPRVSGGRNGGGKR
jgi:release factor glutamine methyltransferase